jgi:hypothetical protein
MSIKNTGQQSAEISGLSLRIINSLLFFFDRHLPPEAWSSKVVFKHID